MRCPRTESPINELTDIFLRIGVTFLGSGSRGNSLLVHTDDSAVMIDAGFSKKETLTRMAAAGVSPESLRALLITHDHSDHVNGARVLADSLEIPSFVTGETYRFLKSKNKIGGDVVLFEPGSEFEAGGFGIRSFSVPHDAVDPVGFVVSAGSLRIGVATDLGHVSRLVAQRLSDCDALILESNHDVRMLVDSDRPPHLIRRILGKHGHLSNDDALAALDSLLTDRCRHLFMAHLSSDCNQGDLVRKITGEKLAELRRADIVFCLPGQAKHLDTVWL